MSQEDISAERLLNMVLDEVDDMITIVDEDHNIIWMNRSAQKKLDVPLEKAVGSKCFTLLGSTCCCDDCIADSMIGGPHRCGCEFTTRHDSERYECNPVPYRKDGKLKVMVQHIRPVNK
jgi:PAS domain-containing protein